MFPIRRRWPILTGLIAATFYAANYYRISGLEHLRVESVASQPSQASPAGTPTRSPGGSLGIPSITGNGSLHDVYGHGGSSTAPASFDSTEYGIRKSDSPSSGDSGGLGNIVWPSQLHAGERFTLLQDHLGSRSAEAASSSKPTLPVSKPISLPPGFQSHGLDGFQSPGGPASLSSIAPPPAVGNQAAGSGQAGAGVENPFSFAPKPKPLGPPGITFSPAGPSSWATSSTGGRIRIASFNTEALGPAKLDKPHVLSLLVGMLRQYDVIALQEVRSTRDDVLPMLVERLNQSGRRYDYMIGPRIGRGSEREQFAFIFDTSRLETDRYRLYTVDDPQDLITFEPLVAWFRCKEAPEQEAFTFSLINTKINPLLAEAEHDILPDLVDAVQADGRQEDDWILLGDLAGSNAQLAILERVGVRFAIRDFPTEVTGHKMLDGLMFSAHATTEYTGRSGALDFLRKHNLSIEQSMEISSHLPIWAEFSVFEGAVPGRVAPGLAPSP